MSATITVTESQTSTNTPGVPPVQPKLDPATTKVKVASRDDEGCFCGSWCKDGDDSCCDSLKNRCCHGNGLIGWGVFLMLTVVCCPCGLGLCVTGLKQNRRDRAIEGVANLTTPKP